MTIRAAANLEVVSPISDREHQEVESILDQWQRELSKPAFGAVTEAIERLFATGLAARLRDTGFKQQPAARVTTPTHGAVAAALSKQFSSGLTPKLSEATGAHQMAARLGAVAADALRPKTIRFAQRLLETSSHKSLVQMQAFELGAGVLARVDVAAAVSVAIEALGDAPAVAAIEDAVVGLDEGPMAEVAESRDWPLLVLLLAVLYCGVLARLVVVENPEAGPPVSQATESLALALLVVLTYAGKGSQPS
jgi:hypothetical protein